MPSCLAYFSYVDKMKGAHDITLLCVCLCISVYFCPCVSVFSPNLLGLWDGFAVCVPHIFFVFYAVYVVSKESRRLVLPRTSCYSSDGMRLRALELRPQMDLLCQPAHDDRWELSNDGNITDRENRIIRRTCSCLIFYTRNPTWTVLELNLRLRKEKLTTDRQGCGAAKIASLYDVPGRLYGKTTQLRGCLKSNCGGVYLISWRIYSVAPRNEVCKNWQGLSCIVVTNQFPVLHACEHMASLNLASDSGICYELWVINSVFITRWWRYVTRYVWSAGNEGALKALCYNYSALDRLLHPCNWWKRLN
jgi:hypothetical protein